MASNNSNESVISISDDDVDDDKRADDSIIDLSQGLDSSLDDDVPKAVVKSERRNSSYASTDCDDSKIFTAAIANGYNSDCSSSSSSSNDSSLVGVKSYWERSSTQKPAKKSSLSSSNTDSSFSSSSASAMGTLAGKMSSLRIVNVKKEYSDDESEESKDSSSEESEDSDDSSSSKDEKLVPGKRLTQKQIKTALAKIQFPKDKALQKLLFEASFRFKLLGHQFEAVRRIAGVPKDFPFHKKSKAKPTKICTWRIQNAVSGLNPPETRGLIVADAMGLGKTVEAIAGAVLCNAIASAKKEKDLPTVIISPNDGVQEQWMETLLKNGVSKADAIEFAKDRKKLELSGRKFVLLTRHVAQAELKKVFHSGRVQRKSRLFPHVSHDTFDTLRAQYNFHHGKESGEDNSEEGEKMEDAITRYIAKEKNRLDGERTLSAIFRMVIVDEVHLLKNRLAYWTMAAALCGLHAQRVNGLSGTPYNNGAGDVASIMTVIDPETEFSTTQWWEETLQDSMTSERIQQVTREWRDKYMLRRGKETIEELLTKKIVQENVVEQPKQGFAEYEKYEQRLLKLLKRFNGAHEDDGVGNNKIDFQELCQMLFSLLCTMRAHLVHPMIPNQGRELTKLFSPSRKHISETDKNSDKVCVVCSSNENNGTSMHAKKQNQHDPLGADITVEEGKHDYDDDIFAPSSGKETLVPLQCCLCIDFTGNNRHKEKHYAHKQCRDSLWKEYNEKKAPVCPRCLDLRKCAAPSYDGAEMWCSDAVPGLEGFPASPKLKAVIQHALSIPKHDKIIFLSFFKGALDLLEAVLHHEKKWKCARFDGDLNSKQKVAELSKFKKDDDCRAILMSVQSGGIGLNLTEANHVVFLDRWLNPFVHDQAEDRAHRIGQKKDVNIVYFDVAASLDECLYEINEFKKSNAKVLLKDELVLDKDCKQGQLSWKELRGLIGKHIKDLNDHRKDFQNASDDFLIPKLSNSIGKTD